MKSAPPTLGKRSTSCTSLIWGRRVGVVRVLGPLRADWRDGDELRWRLVMIGLTEHGGEYERRGYTAEGMARGFRTFRRRGMPFATLPREHVHGTWPMCRAVVAARLTEPGREWSVFRALQVAQFTTTLDLETTEGIAAALRARPRDRRRAPARGHASRPTSRPRSRPTATRPARPRARRPSSRASRPRRPTASSATRRRASSSPATTAAGSRRAASSRPRPTT